MDETSQNSELHHEEQDVNVWAVTKFGIVLVLVCVAALFGLWLLFDHFQAREAEKGPLPSRAVNAGAPKVPPEPRLQPSPAMDLQEMRAAENQLLNSYAWIDPDKGVVRIPVQRALDLLAQRGLPPRPQPAGKKK